MNEAEQKYGIPHGILMAIAKVESGVKIYSLNINGKPHVAKSVKEALLVAKQNINAGITNIDVGIMQLNYRWHVNEFDSLEEMLGPHKNIVYAAFYLKTLKYQYGSWKKAIRYYHSSNIDLGTKYSRKVIATWFKRHRKSINEAQNV